MCRLLRKRNQNVGDPPQKESICGDPPQKESIYGGSSTQRVNIRRSSTKGINMCRLLHKKESVCRNPPQKKSICGGPSTKGINRWRLISTSPSPHPSSHPHPPSVLPRPSILFILPASSLRPPTFCLELHDEFFRVWLHIDPCVEEPPCGAST